MCKNLILDYVEEKEMWLNKMFELTIKARVSLNDYT